MKIFSLFILAFIYSCTGKQEAQAPALEVLPVLSVNSGNATVYSEYPASVEGRVNVEIRPQVNGTLDKVFVDEGAYVTKGTPLFKINARPYQERVNNSKGRLLAAQSALTNARLEVEKLTPLVANKVVSDYQLKTAIATQRIAEANLGQAKADLESARIDLGYTLITAPVNGYIGRLPKKQGSLVGIADPEALAELSDVHEVHVYFSLSESDFVAFKTMYPGKNLEQKIAHLPEVELVTADGTIYGKKGKIELVNGQFDKNTAAITLRASFPNTEGLLRSGNTGKIRLGLEFKNVINIPQAATQEMQDKLFVYLVDKDNTISKKSIEISGNTGSNYIIKAGLQKGDRIVSNGFDHIQEGQKIQPKLAAPKSPIQVATIK
ncbi:efflux RND transporter periplasmic adaptor subunit [Flavobacterium sp. LC2016-01]|uniref:efflux RND transporter periplasmic adaptor subunit n=1 Tax=Flavobacterium sp. LC2016-01 TaxID=2675876 RepID=UPI0012BA8B8F|nr:efflux RND transporter periplasmic adaptor subunit [Flavobacterium sp. LC2016-01]MTH15837.1 efflux RND transporter periplasmic adaptor subunit [Flavobacterium sp. LC2016-01]